MGFCVFRPSPVSARMCARVVVAGPLPRAIMRAPPIVSGRARGAWFLEGGVRLLHGAGNVPARGFATAAGEWMAKGFVPFRGTLAFERPAGPGGGTGPQRRERARQVDGHAEGARARRPRMLDAPQVEQAQKKPADDVGPGSAACHAAQGNAGGSPDPSDRPGRCPARAGAS